MKNALKVKMILFYYCLSFSIITLLTMILMNWIPISHPIGWSLPLYLLVFGFIYKIPCLTVAGFFVCMFMFLTAFLIKNKRIVLPAVLFLLLSIEIVALTYNLISMWLFEETVLWSYFINYIFSIVLLLLMINYFICLKKERPYCADTEGNK